MLDIHDSPAFGCAFNCEIMNLACRCLLYLLWRGVQISLFPAFIIFACNEKLFVNGSVDLLLPVIWIMFEFFSLSCATC